MNQQQAQFNMVEQQIRPWNVLDEHTLELIRSVPRNNFVATEYRDLACADTQLPLGYGEVMMAPKLEARVLQALQITAKDRILEVGTGSGYLTALLAQTGAQICSIDRHADFISAASARLEPYQHSNLQLLERDVYTLLEEPADPHYDVVILTGSLPMSDQRFDQLLTCHGRLFAIIGTEPVMQAHLITRRGDNEWSDEILFETSLPPLHGALQADAFTF